ncbi:heat shock transcription factor B2A [Striga asiatica]|uniref:Heat shock transcription factor B2A n=1 Tax=Striga asiatica TaxID=4170 RepID=A0A5A7PZG4_STRAF|nr:heat shock transcription factor B2A [Striga asiatica]
MRPRIFGVTIGLKRLRACGRKNPCLGTWPLSHTKQARLSCLRAAAGVCLPAVNGLMLAGIWCISGALEYPCLKSWFLVLVDRRLARISRCRKIGGLLLAEEDDGFLGTF